MNNPAEYLVSDKKKAPLRGLLERNMGFPFLSLVSGDH
jgi:hypothetical protein